MLDTSITYQGFRIQSMPYVMGQAGQWQTRICITLENDRGIKTREFSVESIYETEKEATIHGIAFGQRIIDGKIAGHSVADMKTEDRRTTPRLRVQFRTTFSASPTLEGTGLMLDLSVGGCRIESSVSVEPGALLELRIYAPDIEWPLMIEAASVQWVSGQTFGLAFFRIKETELHRLGQVIADLTHAQERN